ncbi:unnamed protein product [Periconia digitata]|uniref:Uncharacterized protein n=1 Tax=Periconia digitata TaxID=1303443 RepID=A0A9W4XX68_9PLEO|nr:unnamed protein product [Periconia digitata]
MDMDPPGESQWLWSSCSGLLPTSNLQGQSSMEPHMAHTATESSLQRDSSLLPFQRGGRVVTQRAAVCTCSRSTVMPGSDGKWGRESRYVVGRGTGRMQKAVRSERAQFPGREQLRWINKSNNSWKVWGKAEVARLRIP